MMPRQRKDSLIAGIITLVSVALLLLALWFGKVDYSGRELAEASVPEITMAAMEEETLLEPELVHDLGEPDAVTHDEPAPAVKGAPEKAETDNVRKVEKGTNPKPAPPVKKKVDTPKKSEVKSTTPSVSDEERKKVTSKTAKAFGGANGMRDGKNSGTGAGGTGVGTAGVVSGRVFKGCPKPTVSLNHTVTVVVDVVINAQGTVISAKARRGGASAEIRSKCEACARSAHWNAKPDAPDAKGTITFTITPK